MIAALLTCCALAAPVLFEPRLIPLSGPGARVLLAPRPGSEGAVLLVAEDRIVSVYDLALPGQVTRIELPEGVSAWEYADIDGDGSAEVVAVRGRDIIAVHPRTAAAEQEEEELLFSRDTLLGGTGAFPHVLTILRDGIRLLALPTREGLEVLTPAGQLIETIERGRGSGGESFSAISVEPSLCAPEEALEFRITYFESGGTVSLPREGPPPGDARMRLTPTRQARDAAALPPAGWPWFPLTARAGGRHRAHYALTGSMPGDTLVAIGLDPQSAEADGAPPRLGPKRRYPGHVLIAEGPPPDFDGDGWTDLMLYSVRAPVPTLNAISRAFMAGHWAIRLTAHRYNEEKRRFDARAGGLIKLDLPIGWLLSAGGRPPLRHVLLRDFDGDGQTDFACCAGPRKFQVWLSNEGAFRTEPDYEYALPGPVLSTLFVSPLNSYSPVSIGFRLEDFVLVLANQRVSDEMNAD